MSTTMHPSKGYIAGTMPEGPNKAGAKFVRKTPPTQFRKYYERGDFPIAIEHDTKGNKIAWKVGAVLFVGGAVWVGGAPR